MKTLIAALTLIATLNAPALTLKWTYAADGALAWSTSGHGALAVVSRPPTGLGAVTWIDPGGRPLFTNTIADLGQDIAGSSVRIVRFSKTELVVQVEASYEHAPGTNFVRRFRRNGTFSDTVLPVGEQMDAQSSTLADSHGYFTREALPAGYHYFRRYSN